MLQDMKGDIQCTVAPMAALAATAVANTVSKHDEQHTSVLLGASDNGNRTTKEEEGGHWEKW